MNIDLPFHRNFTIKGICMNCLKQIEVCFKIKKISHVNAPSKFHSKSTCFGNSIRKIKNQFPSLSIMNMFLLLPLYFSNLQKQCFSNVKTIRWCQSISSIGFNLVLYVSIDVNPLLIWTALLRDLDFSVMCL